MSDPYPWTEDDESAAWWQQQDLDMQRRQSEQLNEDEDNEISSETEFRL